jgi:Bacterial alpha-L-rhamnosidase 6 hairpin glycosidase domain
MCGLFCAMSNAIDSLVQAVSGFGNRIGTGSVALGPLFRTLHAAGRDDLIYAMVSNPESPGYAFLVNSGRTTLTERLDGGGSQDHHFLGQVASWFVHGLAGIDQAPGSIAYDRLVIKPALVGDVARCSTRCRRSASRSCSSWRAWRSIPTTCAGARPRWRREAGSCRSRSAWESRPCCGPRGRSGRRRSSAWR